MSALAIRSALRRLIRAQKAAFHGDNEMLQASMKTIRAEFRKNMTAPAEQVPKMLEEIENGIVFLQNNIVQAPLNARGNYQVDASQVDENKRR